MLDNWERFTLFLVGVLAAVIWALIQSDMDAMRKNDEEARKKNK